MKRFVPLSIPNFNGNEKKYVDDALEQGWVSTGGAYITRLEQQLAEFLKVDKAAACQSGTSGLHLALVECGVQPGDMVIVPTLTFIAAVNPVRYQFAEPVFMDCDESLCLDPEKLAEFCEKECKLEAQQLVHKKSGRVVKAVIVVHVFGNLADMEAIMSIAGEYHLKVVEDATEALGSHYTAGKLAGRYAGTIGDFGVYSFNGNKIITTGGGGAVTARCADEVEHLKYLSTQAKDDPQFYIHNEIGYNYRMTNLQAALGVAQMEELQQFIETKHRNYILYKERFREVSFGTLLPFREGTSSNQWFYSLQLREDRLQGKDMRDIIGALQERGVQTRAIWGLIHEQKPYRQNIAYKIEKAPCYSATVLNIPSSTQLTEEDICYAAEQITEVLGGDEG
ncbi:LegC family aminotransferase [Roseburia hominis]|uniref:LegC family aminotransferase n=1 Tax=Roseburia hominis TaxID=301301 RepID=UPI00307E15C6